MLVVADVEHYTCCSIPFVNCCWRFTWPNPQKCLARPYMVDSACSLDGGW